MINKYCIECGKELCGSNYKGDFPKFPLYCVNVECKRNGLVTKKYFTQKFRN
ncbi:hypothetical protein LCGC14_2103790 [marine sediment metagenome]|uniref:Uncharacterized protein n=1 Tax=marine sediment metagenome TaxID=412755 RepID=A0A0F9H5J4_9ZZZZ